MYTYLHNEFCSNNIGRERSRCSIIMTKNINQKIFHTWRWKRNYLSVVRRTGGGYTGPVFDISWCLQRYLQYCNSWRVKPYEIKLHTDIPGIDLWILVKEQTKMSTIDGFCRWTTLYRSSLRIGPSAKPTTNAVSIGKTAAVTKSSCVLVHEYTSHSTVHGMRYISKASVLEKWVFS